LAFIIKPGHTLNIPSWYFNHMGAVVEPQIEDELYNLRYKRALRKTTPAIPPFDPPRTTGGFDWRYNKKDCRRCGKLIDLVDKYCKHCGNRYED
jgi:hypothetical protein